MSAPTDGSPAGGRQVRTRDLPGRPVSRRRRMRWCGEVDEAVVDTWLAPRRELACDWLRAGSGETTGWDVLRRKAGNGRMGEAQQLLDALLSEGWIELCEQIEKGQWKPRHLRWLHRDRLAARLGLSDPQAARQQAEHLHELGFGDPRLPALADSLKAMRPGLQLKRMQLLHKLDEWLAAGRHGTRRQFALLARGSTKQVSDAEWDWLDDMLGLETLGIEAHTPGLWLRAPLCLRTAEGFLDLRAVPDAIALTPATLAAAVEAEGAFGCWRVVENRTSFEQAARAHGARDGVLWLPGFAPSWWQKAVDHLLQLAPAPLWIACDPDPAGIRIAWSVASQWSGRGLAWHPWRMDADDLLALSQRRALNDYDRAELARLSALELPAPFVRLLTALAEHGKGEQEGLSFA